MIILIRVVNDYVYLPYRKSQSKHMQYPETKKDDIQEVILKTITDLIVG